MIRQTFTNLAKFTEKGKIYRIWQKLPNLAKITRFGKKCGLDGWLNNLLHRETFDQSFSSLKQCFHFFRPEHPTGAFIQSSTPTFGHSSMAM
jgi:hypothetical protein